MGVDSVCWAGMGRTRHQAAKDLFLEARALSAAERVAFLDEACAEASDLRAEVVSLLENDAETGGFLDRGAGFRVGAIDAQPDGIGPYRIIAHLGEGGMGTVYHAEQAHPRRAVALKVVRAGVATPASLRRFEHEVDFLGRLEHPGIARIYDAGRAPEELGGQPYFAMELISGRPITECSLDREGRLRLLLEVCDAVQHAHSRGIVHRDLKPENILVDAEGRPKILDFGIALAIDADASPTAGLTQTGLLLGTVQYMSPEQALAMPGGVDARTDVYSLGVIGYELLSGRLPYDLGALNPLDALRVIREVDPKPLGSIRSELGGDLETIFETALEKERTRRYASASDLAADIRRFLDGEPILARPIGPGGRLLKWMGRHRALVIAIGVALTGPIFAVLGQAVPAYAALVLGLVGTTIGLVRSMRLRREAETERRTARREAEKAKAIHEFLQQMLSSVQSGEQGHDVKVVDVLDRSAGRIGEAFRAQPEVEGPIRLTLGMSYRGLAQYEQALEQLELASDLCARSLGPGHVDSLNALGWTSIVMCEQGRHAEAEPLQARLIDLRRRFQGEDHPDTVISIGQMSWILRALGRREAAIENQRRVVASLTRSRGAEEIDTATAMGTLGTLLGNNEEFEEAEAVLRPAVEAMRRSLSPGHHNLLAAESNFTTVLHGRGKLDEAESHYLESLEAHRSVLGEDHPNTTLVSAQYARLLMQLGRMEEAESLLRGTQSRLGQVLGEKHVATLQSTVSLGELLTKTGRPEEGEPMLALGVELLTGRRRLRTRCALGVCLARLGRLEEAREHLEAGHRGLLEDFGEDHPEVRQAAEELAQLST